MKVLTKVDFGRMELSRLETEKNKVFKKIIKGNEARKNRNILYELLGVIEEKIKFEGIPLEIKLA